MQVSRDQLEHYKEFLSLNDLKAFLEASTQKSKLFLYNKKRLTNETMQVSTVGQCGHQNYKGLSDENWDLGLGYDGAKRILDRSCYWPEGRELFTTEFFKAKEGLQNRQCPSILNDVAGFTPDIPEYLIGSTPCTMYNESETEGLTVSAKPIIKIGINQVNRPHISSRTLINRGSALLAMVDDLERQGFRTEIWSTARVGTCVTVTPELGWDILIKPSTQTADPSMLAFPLGHPAWGRRIGYRIVEAFPVGICDMCGYVTDITPSDHDYDIYIGPCRREDLNTVEKYIEYYQDKFREALAA